MTNLLFKGIIVLAALSVVVLTVTAGYYVFTLKQVERQSETTSSISVPTSLPPAGPATISASDKTMVVEQELNQTSLEDFEADFTALQQESMGL